MKKTKLAGDNISLKTKKTEDPLVMAWLNAQSNLMDSFRYLVENEIMQHGVRNLQMFIPMERAGVPGASDARHAGGYRAVLAEAGRETAAAEEAADTGEDAGQALQAARIAQAGQALQAVQIARADQAIQSVEAAQAVQAGAADELAEAAGHEEESPVRQAPVIDEIDDEDIEAWT